MSLRFCPHCATPLAAWQEQPHRKRCPACGWILWGNPKPAACAIVERRGPRGMEVLLVRRAIAPERGKWDIPGGFLELDETPEQALCRELREETGLLVRPFAYFGAWVDRYPYGGAEERSLNLVFRAAILDEGAARAGDDADQLGWFTAAALPPPDQLAFDSGRAALQQWRALQKEAPDG